MTVAIPHRRRSIRLREYDYSQSGLYFVTLCTHRRTCLFGDITDDQLHLNNLAHIGQATWEAIPEHFTYVELDAWVVMPNHLHGILAIIRDNVVGATESVAPTLGSVIPAKSVAPTSRPHGPGKGSLGAIIGQFKSVVTKTYNELSDMTITPIWQRNYYEHIVRNESELSATRQYIEDNPMQWALDRDNPDFHQ